MARCFEMLESVDTCILGRLMYPLYEQYWMAVLANSTAELPLSGKTATKNEIKYARWADKKSHIVVSKTLDKVAWKMSRIVRDIEEIRKLKERPGKNMSVVGGATLFGSLMNAGLAQCGSRLTGAESDTSSPIVGLVAGSLDDPSWFRPQMDIFTSDAQPWDQMDPAIPKYESYPPG